MLTLPSEGLGLVPHRCSRPHQLSFLAQNEASYLKVPNAPVKGPPGRIITPPTTTFYLRIKIMPIRLQVPKFDFNLAYVQFQVGIYIITSAFALSLCDS
ncbi:unnamed protein product [Prunus armeniaca]